MLVELLDDAEGYIPLEVEYLPALDGGGDYRIIKRHKELASPSLCAARGRAERLARRLKVSYIAHHI